MVWDARTASTYARTQAGATSQRKCAEFTRRAINAGGVNIGNTFHAKDYGGLLINSGFRRIGANDSPKAGDVVVIQPYQGGNPSGHMAIYDGNTWYSDFRQRDMWGGPGYRSAQPGFQIYRKD